MRCDGCDLLHYAVCSGESDPSHCEPGHPDRHRASRFASSLAGWPRRGPNDQVVVRPEPPSDRTPPSITSGRADQDPLVAPRGGGGHAGASSRKPWAGKVTATLACLNSPELAEVAVNLLRLQTAKPYLVVVDTGSSESNLNRLEALRAPDLEIHHVRAGGYQHSSDPVAIACDLAQARCQTEYLYFTHADCFTMRRDWLEYLLTLCDVTRPVVGYQLTDRGFATKEWPWMVGHTATMTHAPTIRRANCWWSYQWMNDLGDRPESETYWDTEVGFCWALKRAGIAPKLIGTEANYARNRDTNIDHVRSFASRQIYGEMIGPPEYKANVESWASAALAEAKERIAAWTIEVHGKPRVPLGTPHCVPCLQKKP